MILFICIIVTINGRIIPLSTHSNSMLTIDTVTNTDFAIISKDNLRKNGWDNWEEPSTGPPEPGTSVCYSLVGCFDNDPPFDNAGLEVPQDPSIIKTDFLLFTSSQATSPEILEYDKNDKSIIDSKFNNSQWLRIIVHGFTNNRHSPWIPRLTEELLKLKDNEASAVLVVDWGSGAKFPFYNKAAANIRLVGKQISLILKKMKTLKKLSYDKVHCIGHSLGAHTCGYASNGINNQIGRITGLDPAGPFFEGKPNTVRLDQKDGKFVDVIHTNTEIALGIGLGSKDPSGHIDFYVNGGKQQPGCPSTVAGLIGGLLPGQSESGFEQSSCSHSRSHGYFIESIHSQCPYTAYQCQDFDSFRKGQCLSCETSGCSQMGFYAKDSVNRGNMYLSTKSHHYYIELSLNEDMMKTIGEIYVSLYSNYELLTNLSMTHKSNVEIKGGNILRHVFSSDIDYNNIDYAIIYFYKGKSLFNLGGPYANDIRISYLQVKSADGSLISDAVCDFNTTIPSFTEHTLLFNRHHK
ncbi:unnamed protein product [Adineta ricciae]|uniref:Lipase domain-containing protein n=1 Tax=Adineta ricciae TaxID=249248 RepID=A0A814W7E9_ADIRI|nr:unnamed protein product [Adineta ricciae]